MLLRWRGAKHAVATTINTDVGLCYVVLFYLWLYCVCILLYWQENGLPWFNQSSSIDDIEPIKPIIKNKKEYNNNKYEYEQQYDQNRLQMFAISFLLIDCCTWYTATSAAALLLDLDSSIIDVAVIAAAFDFDFDFAYFLYNIAGNDKHNGTDVNAPINPTKSLKNGIAFDTK